MTKTPINSPMGWGASGGTLACDDPTEAIMTGTVTDLLRV
jgi:hypothetical protein